jgi:hypothetical protein
VFIAEIYRTVHQFVKTVVIFKSRITINICFNTKNKTIKDKEQQQQQQKSGLNEAIICFFPLRY